MQRLRGIPRVVLSAIGRFVGRLVAQFLRYSRERINAFVEGCQLLLSPPRFATPLSTYAANKIKDVRQGWKQTCLAVTAICLLCLLFAFVIEARYEASLLLFVGKGVLFVWLVGLTGMPWRQLHIIRLKMANEIDFHTSQRVIAALEGLTRPVTHYQLAEEPQPGNWQPFRVLHQFGYTLRGQMGSDALQVGGILPRVIDGTIRGSIVSDLLDSSTVLLVINDREETMRVLLPSARFARETINGIKSAFLGDQAPGTHTYLAIANFKLPPMYVELPLSHADVVDRMDAMIAANKPLSERPTLNFVGKQLRPGILVATGMVIGEELHTVLPTGFFKALADDLGPLLGTPADLQLNGQAAISA